jgi:hypothetical protein
MSVTMLAENTNRMDTGPTVIPQSAVPVRETTSPGVLFRRELLKAIQLDQKSFIMQADMLRMRHVTNMTIISGRASPEVALRSSQTAALSAEARRREVAARSFDLPVGLGTTPRPCSDWK